MTFFVYLDVPPVGNQSIQELFLRKNLGRNSYLLSIEYVNNTIEAIKPLMSESEYNEFVTISKMVNSMVGPITSVLVQQPDFFDPPITTCTAEHYRITSVIGPSWMRLPNTTNILVPAGGKGFDIFSSMMGAIGEAIERLFAILYYAEARDRIVYSTPNELSRKGYLALGPDQVALFADWQYSEPGFNYHRFEYDSKIGWLEGKNAITGEKVLVPAQLVMMYYTAPRDETKIGYPTSGGLSFRRDERQAIIHGVLETIERDAINLRWCSGMPFTRIDIDPGKLVAKYDARLKPFANRLQDIQLYHMTVDIEEVEVVAAFAFNNNIQELAFASGAAASLGRLGAIIGAIHEVGQSSNSLKYVDLSSDFMGYINRQSTWRDIGDFFDNLIYYGFSDNLQKLKARLMSSKLVEYPDDTSIQEDIMPENSKKIESILKKHDFDAIILDFTPFHTSEYNIKKIFIPQLTQAFVASRPYLGHPRFYEIPRKLGYSKRKIKPNELSLEPIPLP
jgi:ribosomal protein S12 methylthiotransferase accessory factor